METDTTGVRPLVSRLAGVAGIGVIVLAFAPGSLGGPFFSDWSDARTVSWVVGHPGAIAWEGFLGGLEASLLAAFVGLLVVVTGVRSRAAAVAWAGVTAMVAVDWVAAGVYYALEDAARRWHDAGAILGLFSLAKMLTFSDGFAFGAAIVAVCLVSLRSGALPRAVAVTGLVMGGYHMVNTPIQLALNGRPDGVTGPIGVVLLLTWTLAVALILLIRPVRPLRVSMPAERLSGDLGAQRV